MSVEKTAEVIAVSKSEIAASITHAGESVIKYANDLYHQNTLQNWGGAAIAFAVTLALAFLLRIIADRRLHWLAKRHLGTTELLVQRLIRRTHLSFFLAMALYFGSIFLNQTSETNPFATVAVIMLLVQSLFWFNEFIEHFVSEYRRKKLEDDAASVMTIAALGFIAKLVVCIVIGLLLLVNLGVNIGPLLATVGVASLAIGLALQNILADLFASLSIVLDKPFVLGDFIVIDDKMGTVEDIGLKTTRLRSISGEQLIFGNGDLLKSRIRNYKRMQERRVVFRFGLAYQTPTDKIIRVGEIAREIIEAIPETRFDRAHMVEFAENSLQFEVVYFVLKPDYNLYRDIQQTINIELIKHFESNEIAFARPGAVHIITGPTTGVTNS